MRVLSWQAQAHVPVCADTLRAQIRRLARPLHLLVPHKRNMNLEAMRVNYNLFELKDEAVQAFQSPIEFFSHWLQEAVDSGKEVEPNAMTLATCSAFVCRDPPCAF